MTKLKLTIFIPILLSFCSAIAHGQHSVITNEIRKDGKVINVVRSLDQYQPLWDAADNSAVHVTKNLSYGPHAKQSFDLYEPKKIGDTKSPILVFLHGGSFVAGDKSMYANVGYHFAKKGITSVIMTYRLAPEYKWPTGTLDLALQLKWIRDNPNKIQNGDVRKIFLFGHSAGAQHAASYIFEEEYQIENDGVIGAILASGSVYDTSILNHDVDPQYYDYFGRDPSKYPSMSVLNKLEGRTMPIFIASAEYDKANFEYQAITMLNALYQLDKTLTMYKQILDHNHLSEIFQFNTGEETFNTDILEFIHSKSEKR
jgi:acetyl esterase